MEIIKTICPRCFKIFKVSEEIDKVVCIFCEYIYDLPKLTPREEQDKNDFLEKYYLEKLYGR